MGSYGNEADNSKAMHNLLISLDDALRRQRKTKIQDRATAETIVILQKICEVCSSTEIQHVCDLTSQVSSYLYEVTTLNIPICEEIMAHLYVTRALIHEAYDSYINGQMLKTAARTSALIGSFHRCIRNLSSGSKKSSHYPYSLVYNRTFV